MQKSEQIRKRERALRAIYITYTLLLLAIVAICSISFTAGHIKKYDEMLAEYTDDVRQGFIYSNLEGLAFLQTDDIVEYKKVFKDALKQNDLYNSVRNVSILDTIAKLRGANQYEWYAVCDDKDSSVFINSYDEGTKSFTISLFEDDSEASLSEEQIEKIQIKNEDEEETGYMNGSLSELEAVNPEITNIKVLPQSLRNISSSMLGSFRKFLVETKNNRRSFSVAPGSIRDTSSTFVCTLRSDVTLRKNNTVKMSFLKHNKAFTFDYAD